MIIKKGLIYFLASITACFLILFPVYSFAQSTWAHAYGTTLNDNTNSIQQTGDGGYIATGYTTLTGGNIELLVLKLDSTGNIIWQKTYGSTGEDCGNSIQKTIDGGYIVAGYSKSFTGGNMDVWILKLDASGNIGWQKAFGGSADDTAYSIQQTGDGGYIAAGSTKSFGAGYSDFWVLKLDSSGNVSWQETYGGSSNDIAYSIQQTGDGGYIVAGSTASFGVGSNDFWVLKLDSSGNILWQKTYGESADDVAYSIQQTTDGGYIIAGHTLSFGAGFADIMILKLDASGNILWQKTYGGQFWDEVSTIRQTADGNYIVSGYSLSFNFGSYDIWIFKLDSSGKIIWQKVYGDAGVDIVRSIQQTSELGYILAGYTQSYGSGNTDILVVKINAFGNLYEPLELSCLGINNTNIQPTDSIAVSTNTNAIFSSPAITITGTSILPVTSSVIDTVVCVSCPPATILNNNTAVDVNGCAYTGVRVSWAADPGDWGDGGTGTRTYAVLRDSISIATGLAYGTTTFLDTGGTHGQTYLYQVQYSNGCTSTANTTGIQTADYPALPTVMDTTAMDKSPMLDTGVKILWSPPTDWGDSGTNTASRAFRVYRGSTDISGLLPASTLSYEDTGGVNNTDYLYHINAINGCGMISIYNSMTARDAVSAPGTVPDNDNFPGIPLTISKSGTNNIILNWGAPAGSCQTQDYGIYRGTLPWTAYNHASVLCTTGGSTTMTILAGTNSYYYIVVAQYGGNEGSYGLDSSNNQRPHAGTSCFPQSIGSCESGTWAHEYGAAGIDQAYAMQITNDGGYVIAGYTESLGANSNDVWVVKLDSSGNISWQKTYGGNSDDLAYSIQQTSDGGYIVAGITLSFGAGKGDAWVLKLDSSGNVTWQKAYGGLNFDVAYSVRQTSDGGYIVAGNTSTNYDDAWILRLDSSGNIIWQYTYGGPNSDYAYSVQQTSDQGFIVAGDTYSFGSGSSDLWVFKLTSTGFASWQKIYGGSSSEHASSVQQTSDGGYVVAGYTTSFGAGNSDAWILDLDASGTVIWQKTYGGSDSEQVYSIQQTSDGGYIAAAIGPLSYYPWIFKLDSSGNIIWQKAYSGDMINSIQKANDGGYVVSGYASDNGSQDFWIFKISPDGTMAPSCTFINNTSISSNDSLAASSYITPTILTPAIAVTDTSVSAVNSNGIDTLICPFPFK